MDVKDWLRQRNIQNTVEYARITNPRHTEVPHQVVTSDKVVSMMAIPDYQLIMLPLLRLAAVGEAHRLRNAVEQLADEFELLSEERVEQLPVRYRAIHGLSGQDQHERAIADRRSW